MIEQYYSQAAYSQRLRYGPLEPHLDSFAGWLAEQGYSRQVGKQKIRLVADLSRWLDRKVIPVEELNERWIDSFFRTRWRRMRRSRSDRSTLTCLLEHLRKRAVIRAAITAKADDPINRLEKEYARFLIEERGLSQATLDNYLPVARRFLCHRFGEKKIRLAGLRLPDVTEFILSETSSFSRRRVQLMTSALRSFLGFIHQHGYLASRLAASVPTVASWPLSDLPQFLQPEQVERLLRSCDQTHLYGKRDYAILLLLARLGLRAGEVVHLSLDDIHWEAGHLLIRGKSSREDRLPLPHDVGAALAKYLQEGRPGCSSRRVFIRTKAPHQGFFGSSAICCIVRRALERAGINPERKGAHLLRHSLATGMLRTGASLMEIGQILRHQQVQTTEIYAKVDVRALRALAQPWPGGAQ